MTIAQAWELEIDVVRESHDVYSLPALRDNTTRINYPVVDAVAQIIAKHSENRLESPTTIMMQQILDVLQQKCAWSSGFDYASERKEQSSLGTV